MSPALKDKVAIITGGGRGIGRAFAVRFAAEGAKLLLPDISLERAEDAVKEIRSKGGQAVWYGINITPWTEWTVDEWDRIFSVNVRGTWLCCKAIAPLMIKQSSGKIINIASNVARVPAAQHFLPYSVSKGAVYTLTHALARALGPSSINVNAIGPGYTASEASLNQVNSAEIFKIAIPEQSIPRREEVSDLVGTAVFLASADSDFMSGQVLFVDGGTVML
jgi:3-oxoacyl-[acyl-carrier protein] reductase